MTQWSCVYNIADFSGTPDAAFAAAQAAAVASGGGVVYFPAGTYAFSKNITLASNVVIRGLPTTAPAKAGKNPGTLAPRTKFTCPDRMHQGIWNIDPASTNLGVVNVELAGCAVMLWPGLQTVGDWDFKTYWFFATGVTGMGSNKLVLGNVVHDVSYGHSDPSNPSTSNPYPWVFSTAIAVYSDRNALVANNLLPRASSSASVTLDLKAANGSTVHVTVPYPYDNRYGIDVNQVLLGGAAGHAVGTTCPSTWGDITPACFPALFRAGLVIRDNYVYQNGRVGVAWTGGPPSGGPSVGGGTQVVNNHVEVAAGSTCWTVDGVHVARGSDTNENRGYNQQGYGSNVTLNSGRIHRQTIPFTSYETVDGEGVLMQAVNGASGIGGRWDRNDLTGGESGYMGYYDLPLTQDCVITNNIVNPDQFIGGVLIAAGDAWKSNTCSGNTPAATVCNNGKCQPC